MSKLVNYVCASVAAAVLSVVSMDYYFNTRRTFEGNNIRASRGLFGIGVHTEVDFADGTRTNLPYKMCPYEMEQFLLENADKARLPIDPRINKPFIRIK